MGSPVIVYLPLWDYGRHFHLLNSAQGKAFKIPLHHERAQAGARGVQAVLFGSMGRIRRERIRFFKGLDPTVLI